MFYNMSFITKFTDYNILIYTALIIIYRCIQSCTM